MISAIDACYLLAEQELRGEQWLVQISDALCVPIEAPNVGWVSEQPSLSFIANKLHITIAGWQLEVDQQTATLLDHVTILNRHLAIAWQLNKRLNNTTHNAWQQMLNRITKPAVIMFGADELLCNSAYRSLNNLVGERNIHLHTLNANDMQFTLKVISDPVPSTKQLVEHYGLSQTESEVSRLLCLGLKMADIAEQMQHSPATTKTVLKRIYKKLAVNQQSQLVAKVLTGNATWI